MNLGQLLNLKIWKRHSKPAKIPLAPQCLDSRFHHFVGAEGKLYPCCFVRVGQAREDLKALLGDDFEKLSLQGQSFDQVVESRAWRKIMRSIAGPNPMRTCVEMCAAKVSLDNRQDAAPGTEHDGRNRYRKFSNNKES